MKSALIIGLVGPVWLLAIVALIFYFTSYVAIVLLVPWVTFWAYAIKIAFAKASGTVDSPVIAPEQITAVVLRDGKRIKRVTGKSR